jgi:hypothetical protein
MQPHRTDLVALLFGAAFAIAGVGFLVRETTDAISDPSWATGLGLLLLGAIALVATLGRSRRDPIVAPVSAASSEAADDIGEG